MIRKLTLPLIVGLCLSAMIYSAGCRSAFAEGAYARLGHVTLEALAEAPRARIESVLQAHSDPAARDRALWRAGEGFEKDGQFEAALVSYREITRGGCTLSAEAVEDRIRACRARLAVDRRWEDEKLRATARTMEAEEGLRLFREVVKTVRTHYADPVPYPELLRGGLDNLEAATGSPLFRRRFDLADRSRETAEFRAALESLGRRLREERDMSSFTARYYVRQACEESRRTLRLPDGVIVSEFIFGAAEHLDPYSAYLTHEMYARVTETIRGSFVGLGIEVRRENGRLLVVNVFDGGPAHEAGLERGDVIVRVGNTEVADAGLDRAVRLLRGKRGTEVAVSVRRDGVAERFTVVRGRVSVPSVREARRLGPDDTVAYVHITGFHDGTDAELARTLARLESEKPLEGLVLDLRDNAGGLLEASVEVCNLFLDQGTIVTTRGRGFGQTRSYRVNHWRHDRRDYPVAVLVNRRTASAAEIVTAALKDHGRATVIGGRTFGKGVVQSILPVETGRSAVYLTTARFYGPDGESFHGTGIAPDLEVAAIQGFGGKPETGSEADPADDPAVRKGLRVLQRPSRPQAPTAQSEPADLHSPAAKTGAHQAAIP